MLNLPTLDLPTEAEWEFACRAGTLSARYDGTDFPESASGIAWLGEGKRCQPHAVGLLKPNGYGLYDMYGNTMERCLDWFGMYQNTDGISVDPSGPLSGTTRVDRGGSLDHNSTKARSAARDSNAETSTSYYNGLRVKCATALSL